jgi:hypothetical protein
VNLRVRIDMHSNSQVVRVLDAQTSGLTTLTFAPGGAFIIEHADGPAPWLRPLLGASRYSSPLAQLIAGRSWIVKWVHA